VRHHQYLRKDFASVLLAFLLIFQAQTAKGGTMHCSSVAVVHREMHAMEGSKRGRGANQFSIG
jgi:hypothetical protein